MTTFEEASIIINGNPLSKAQSMTLRVALESFASTISEDGLGDDAHGKFMSKAYLDNCSTIRKLMGYG